MICLCDQSNRKRHQKTMWFIESTSEWQTTDIRCPSPDVATLQPIFISMPCFPTVDHHFKLIKIIRILLVWIFISDPIPNPLTDSRAEGLAFKWVPATPDAHRLRLIYTNCVFVRVNTINIEKLSTGKICYLGNIFNCIVARWNKKSHNHFLIFQFITALIHCQSSVDHICDH